MQMSNPDLAGLPEESNQALLAALIDRLQEFPNEVLLLQSVGKLRAQQRDVKQAVKYFLRASLVDPGCVEALANCGLCFAEMGKDDRAEAFLVRALALNPNCVQARIEIGRLHFRRRQTEDALSCFREVLDKYPSHTVARNNVGAVHWQQGNVAQATECFEQAVETADNAEALSNLAAAYMEDHRTEEAEAVMSRVVALTPEHAEAHFLRAHGLLLAGRWEEGWEEYEWRFQLRRLSLEIFQHLPHWKGEPLADKTILVVSEQGLGDSLLALRYLPLLQESGAQVKLKVQPRLASLVLASMPQVELVPSDEGKPEADFYVHMMSLPHRFRTEPDSVPKASGYLKIRAAVAKERSSESALLRVGLCWSCNEKSATHERRSIPLNLLQRHFGSLPRLQFVSLQHGPAAEAAFADTTHESWLEDGCSGDSDFLDTAVTVAGLDLVISIDTAVAHLAGAMGKPTWILLPHVADWRWLCAQSRTPWYTNASLHRQPAMNDWEGLLRKTALQLAALRPVQFQHQSTTDHLTSLRQGELL